MIVPDSSVWISHIRDVVTPAVERLRAIRDLTEVVVGDLVLLEVLQGARDESHALRLERTMRTYDVVRLLDPDRAVRAARHYRRLRARGVTVRKTPDLVIATFCIDHGFELLQQDRDFLPMAEHLGLRLA